MKYKLPKLYKGKEWFIEYAVQHPETGEWWPKKERAGLNKKSLTNKQRSENAKDAIAALTELLKQGQLNPWAEAVPQETSLSITEAIKLALEKKRLTLSSRSTTDYTTTVNYFIAALQDMGNDSIPAKSFGRRLFIDTLDFIQAKHKCTPHRINMHQQYMSALMSKLLDMEVVDVNPLFRLSKKKEPAPTLLIPPTDAEQVVIDLHLFEHDRPLFVYKSIIYTTGVRVFEVLNLKVSDIDFKNDCLFISITKGGMKSKTVPLFEDLKALLIDHVKDSPGNYYVFSTVLLPGPVKVGRNRVTRRWKRAIIDGLGINRKLYSQKHKGTDDKILAGIPLELLRQMYGHSSSRMTERYASELKNKAFEEIKKKSPGIIPK